MKRTPPVDQQKKRKHKRYQSKESSSKSSSKSSSNSEENSQRQRPSRSRPQTPYEILGISSNATTQEIRRAYKLRALSLHPDKNPGRDTTKLFQQLVAAYESLIDSDS